MYFTGPSVYRIERPGPESTPSPKLSNFVYPPDANAAVDAARRPDWGRILATLIRLARDEAPATVRFTKRNDFGILDRHADARPRIPMRVIANGTGNGGGLRVVSSQRDDRQGLRTRRRKGWIRPDSAERAAR